MRMGEAVETFAVLTATIPGTILIYSGQEAAFNRMLSFFEKDQIDWNDYAYHSLYKKLLGMKKSNKALWNGSAGGTFARVTTTHDDKVFAFLREKDGDRVLVVLNLSGEALQMSFSGDISEGSYHELFTDQAFEIKQDTTVDIGPWGYYVFE